MEVLSAECSFAVLDEDRALDSVCLFIGEDDRPLQGLAGLVDWRLCGRLSALLKAGRLTGAGGEQLLLSSLGFIKPPRIFCFGVGEKKRLSADALTGALSRSARALARAKVAALVAEPPPAVDLSPPEVAKALVEQFGRELAGRRMLLVGARER